MIICKIDPQIIKASFPLLRACTSGIEIIPNRNVINGSHVMRRIIRPTDAFWHSYAGQWNGEFPFSVLLLKPCLYGPTTYLRGHTLEWLIKAFENLVNVGAT